MEKKNKTKNKKKKVKWKGCGNSSNSWLDKKNMSYYPEPDAIVETK